MRVDAVGQKGPLVRIIEQGESPLFSVGDGADIHVYDCNFNDFRDWPAIVREHGMGGTIVLDRSTEAALLQPWLAPMLLDAIGDAKRIVIVCQNLDVIEAINALNDERLKAAYFHSFMRSLNWHHRIFSGTDAMIALKTRRARGEGREFSCLLNRARSHRFVIFGWLAERGYIERGNVSFHGGELMADPKRFDEQAEVASQVFSSFTSAIAKTRASSLPFSNFETMPDENFIVSVDGPSHDAPVSLCAETEMGRLRRFTEKSLKCLVAGHRTLIAGNVGVCKLLSDIGLVLPGFDASYDTIEDADARLVNILGQFERYMEMPEGERRDWLDASWLQCLENMETFCEKTDAAIARSFEGLAAALA